MILEIAYKIRASLFLEVPRRAQYFQKKITGQLVTRYATFSNRPPFGKQATPQSLSQRGEGIKLDSPSHFWGEGVGRCSLLLRSSGLPLRCTSRLVCHFHQKLNNAVNYCSYYKVYDLTKAMENSVQPLCPT